jgi:hypothetical protein
MFKELPSVKSSLLVGYYYYPFYIIVAVLELFYGLYSPLRIKLRDILRIHTFYISQPLT